ncbi:MAG: isoprenylcysteine carboxyl methyltransferase family protein [Actinomycetota bacterium]|jgi:methyltransferase|nr:isoprenylcysteine carboxyl methyltransferase family protein [Actinomycetota bacterium]
MVTAYVVLLVAVTVERLAELVVSTRHAVAMLSRGGKEHGAGHYPVMVALHTALIVGCLVEVLVADRPFIPALGWTMFVVVGASQALRWWCIATLGEQWNTRVIVSPAMPLVAHGPYRWLRHPNYVAVVAEGLALPLVHTAWVTALVFTVANAALLTVRIRVENAALATAPASPSVDDGQHV